MSFFGKVNFFHDFQTLPAEKYPTFAGKNLASLSKMQIGCPGDEFKGKNFLKRIEDFGHFRILSENNSDFWQKNLAGLSKLQFTSTEERFNIVSPRKYLFIFFGLYLQNNNSNFAWNFSGELVENANCLSRATFCGEKFFLKKYNFFHHIRILNRNISDYWRKSFGRVVKNANWVSKRTFWGQTIFRKNICSFWSFCISRHFLWELWKKHFNTVVLTAFYLSRWRVWAELFFLEKLFFCHFCIFSEKFGISGKNSFSRFVVSAF